MPDNFDTLDENPARFFEKPGQALFNEIGMFTLNVAGAVGFILKGRIDWKKVMTETASIGFDSLPMTMLICVISGSVLALQTAKQFALTGADAYVGGLVVLALVREMAPMFTCLTVGARNGTAIAAEIANMQITEQVSALKVMHVSPIRYLVVPRLIACVIALPMLTLLGEIMGTIGGMFVAKGVTNLHYSKYLDSVWLNLTRHDVCVSMYKAAVFGLILAGISCTVGLNTTGGAKDVGLSTTRAVVWIAIAMIVADFFLTWIFFGTSWS